MRFVDNEYLNGKIMMITTNKTVRNNDSANAYA